MSNEKFLKENKIISISLISEASFSPRLYIKLENGEEESFSLNKEEIEEYKSSGDLRGLLNEHFTKIEEDKNKKRNDLIEKILE